MSMTAAQLEAAPLEVGTPSGMMPEPPHTPAPETMTDGRRLRGLRERAAQEHRITRRLNDAITVLLLLIAFPFGMALLALTIVFGRSLPRAMAAITFMAAVNVTALANTIFFDGNMYGVLSNNSGLLSLFVKIAQASVS